MKRLFLLLSLILVLTSVSVPAKVTSTKNAANKQMVYVAGNPDMYPIEYYDIEEEKYKGVLPEIYEKISKENGISFSYVSASKDNNQESLAKNEQVEVVSAHEAKSVDGLSDEVYMFTYNKDEKSVKVYVGFTPLASKKLKKEVTEGIKKFSKKDLYKTVMKSANDFNPHDHSVIIAVIITLAVIVVLFAIILVIRILISKRKKKNSQIDKLTGLGNFLYFQHCYNEFISPISSVLYYIVYVGIDHDRIVHYSDENASKEVQKLAAFEISSMTKDNDFCARIQDGGFVMAIQQPDEERAEIAVDELLNRLNNMGHAAMNKYSVFFKAGIYHLDDKNVICERAINNAQYGYNKAVEKNKPYVSSDFYLLSQKDHENELEKKLWKALNGNEFKVYLQYIYDGKGEKVCGAESLSRWESVEEGLIYPNVFVPMLEKANLIDKLDMHMLDNCCRLLEEWKDTEKKNIWLSCNMTRVTLMDSDFLKKFKKIIDRYDFDLSKLVLEITENFYVDNSMQVIKNIVTCKEMGVQIALDDFGCSFSSVRDMCDYPTDIVKIDLSIIANIEDENRTRFFEGLVGFIHHMGMKAVFECVEDDDDMKLVTDSKCDYIQGFKLARVNPAGDESVEKNLTFK